MRRTTDPLDSPADTGPTLPIAYLASGAPQPRVPDSATKTLQPVLIRLRKWEDVQKAPKLTPGRNTPEPPRYRAGPARARASALASALRIRNHGPRAPACSCCAAVPPAVPLQAVPLQPRIPGVPRMGTNGSTMLEPLRQGLPPPTPQGLPDRRPALCPHVTKRSAEHGSSPGRRWSDGSWATVSTMSPWWCPNSSPTPCATHCPAIRPGNSRTRRCDCI